ncbi:MAG: type II secretion system protein [Oligoflexia bacterium]|nr:type II secretion system protein [Oligoflexia bacterium]
MKKKHPSMWKTFTKLFSRQSGFSLAEIMVAAGLLGVVSLGVMQVMQNISRGSKKLEQDQEKSNIRATLTNIFRNKANCDAALGGLTIAPQPLGTNIPNGRIKTNPAAATTFMELGTEFGSGTKGAQVVTELKIFGYRTGPGVDDNSIAVGAFNQYQYTDGAGNLQTRRRGTIEVRVRLQKGHANSDADAAKRGSFGSATSLIRLDVDVVADTANVIESCFGSSDEYASAACNAMGGSLATDGSCRNIVIQNDTSLVPPGNIAAQFNPDPNRYSMLVKGPLLLLGQGDDLTTGVADDGDENGGLVVSVNQTSMGGGAEAGALAPTQGPAGANVNNDRSAGDVDVEGRVRIGFGAYDTAATNTAARRAVQNSGERGMLQVQRNTILQGNVSIGDVAVPAYNVGNVDDNGFLTIEEDITVGRHGIISMNLGVGKAARAEDTVIPVENGFVDVAYDVDIDRDLIVNRNAQIDQNTRSENISVGKPTRVYDPLDDGYIDALRDISTDRSLYADVDANITNDVNVTNGNVNIQGTDGDGDLNLLNGDINVTQGYLDMVNGATATSYIRLRATPSYTDTTTLGLDKVPNIRWVRNYVVEEIAKTFTANGTDLANLRADILNLADGNAGIDAIRAYTCDALRLRTKAGGVISEATASLGTCSFASNDTNCNSNDNTCNNVYAGLVGGTTGGTVFARRICIGVNRNECKTTWAGGLTISGCTYDSYYLWAHSGNSNDSATSGSYNNDFNCSGSKVMTGLRRSFTRVSSGVYNWRSYIRCCTASP